MSITRAQSGSSQVTARRGFQRVMCGIGHHVYETVGARVDTAHRYSDVHETLYEVRYHRDLLRCPCCGSESIRTDNVEEVPLGRYEHAFRQEGV